MAATTSATTTPTPSPSPNAYLSIIVNKGSPLNYPQYRHTALWIQFSSSSSSSSSLLAHVTGSTGMFQFEIATVQEGGPSDPTTRRESFARKISVGPLSLPVDAEQRLRLLLGRVRVDNGSREFNCQTWVESAIKMLVDEGVLARGDYERGLDGMVDAIAEAEDEEGD